MRTTLAFFLLLFASLVVARQSREAYLQYLISGHDHNIQKRTPDPHPRAEASPKPGHYYSYSYPTYSGHGGYGGYGYGGYGYGGYGYGGYSYPLYTSYYTYRRPSYYSYHW